MPREEEWCERRLLARIHRYTVKRLRAEIEPVPARDFLRFLVRMAAGAARGAHAGVGCAWRPCSRSSKASKRRRARGRPTSCPRASPNTSRSGWTSIAAPGASCGRGWRRACAPISESRRLARALDAHHAARAAQRQGVVGLRRQATIRRTDLAERGRSWTSSRRTALRSSTRSPTASACCRSRWRRRWRSWWRSAS